MRLVNKRPRIGNRRVDIVSPITLASVSADVRCAETRVPLPMLESEVVLHAVRNLQIRVDCSRRQRQSKGPLQYISGEARGNTMPGLSAGLLNVGSFKTNGRPPCVRFRQRHTVQAASPNRYLPQGRQARPIRGMMLFLSLLIIVLEFKPTELASTTST